MRYMLLIYGDTDPAQSDVSDEAQRETLQAYGKYTQDLQQRGVMRSGDALQPVTSATTVRVRNGQRLVTDGPFAETKEALGGFYIVEARDLDEAIELAAACPGAQHGSMEVRPIWELPADYPSSTPATANVAG
jgi:hypothetical protein